MIGSAIFAVYALCIRSYPTAVMNFALVGVNIYFLYKIKNTERNYVLIEGNQKDGYLEFLLEHYKDDIRKYFPEFQKEQAASHAWIVCHDTVPAGVLLGSLETPDTINIDLDYSTPAYRDCSVGKFLYGQQAKKGIKKLIFDEKTINHEVYLNQMGFVKEGDRYVKQLNE